MDDSPFKVKWCVIKMASFDISFNDLFSNLSISLSTQLLQIEFALWMLLISHAPFPHFLLLSDPFCFNSFFSFKHQLLFSLNNVLNSPDSLIKLFKSLLNSINMISFKQKLIKQLFGIIFGFIKCDHCPKIKWVSCLIQVEEQILLNFVSLDHSIELIIL